jgi:Protein of unknown function (DUF3634)
VELLVKVVVLGLVVAGFWFVLQPRYAFVIRIEGGAPRITRGKVTPAFARAVAQVCAELGVQRGWVGGVYRGRRIALAFSRGMARQCRQRLRNAWLVQG